MLVRTPSAGHDQHTRSGSMVQQAGCQGAFASAARDLHCASCISLSLHSMTCKSQYLRTLPAGNCLQVLWAAAKATEVYTALRVFFNAACCSHPQSCSRHSAMTRMAPLGSERRR